MNEIKYREKKIIMQIPYPPRTAPFVINIYHSNWFCCDSRHKVPQVKAIQHRHRLPLPSPQVQLHAINTKWSKIIILWPTMRFMNSNPIDNAWNKKGKTESGAIIKAMRVFFCTGVQITFGALAPLNDTIGQTILSTASGKLQICDNFRI